MPLTPPQLPAPPPILLTLTIASLVCAMSEMTPSVMMRSTEYWEPSCTSAAFLGWSRGGGLSGGKSSPHPQGKALNPLGKTVLWLAGVGLLGSGLLARQVDGKRHSLPLSREDRLETDAWDVLGWGTSDPALTWPRG